jgi:hypothetical protein
MIVSPAVVRALPFARFVSPGRPHLQWYAAARQQDLGTTGAAVVSEQDLYEGRTRLVVHQLGQFKRRTVVLNCVVIGHDVEPSTAILEKDRYWQIFARSAGASAELVGSPIGFQGIRIYRAPRAMVGHDGEQRGAPTALNGAKRF